VKRRNSHSVLDTRDSSLLS